MYLNADIGLGFRSKIARIFANDRRAKFIMFQYMYLLNQSTPKYPQKFLREIQFF
jgi:hypothetical protein